MRKLVYHVAMTLDNYICHEDGSIDGFSEYSEGEHVSEYLETLEKYDTVVMGRKTYEFGYQYGLQPGQPAYPHMKHYIFSKTLHFDKVADERVEIIDKNAVEFIQGLKGSDGTDIYLCGGGVFAGYLLDHRLIDELKIKFYPIILGRGIRLFGNSTQAVDLSLIGSKVYKSGAMLINYQVRYQ